MNKFLIFGVLILSSSTSLFGQLNNQQPETGRVTKIVSGDVIEVRTQGRRVTIRLLGIMAPTQAYSEESRASLSKLLRNKTVEFIRREDSGDVIRAKVLVAGFDASLSQLQNGQAWFETNAKDIDLNDYREATDEAKRSNLGLWGASYNRCVDEDTDEGSTNSTKSTTDTVDSKFKVFGKVILQVVINTDGSVKSARAFCGHPQLQTLATKAALSARFEGGREYLIEGKLTYDFKPKD